LETEIEAVHLQKLIAHGKIISEYNFNFSLFLTQSHCMASEDLD